MDIPTEMKLIASRLKAAGHTVADLLRRADVDRAQWERWKTGRQSPQIRTWNKVVEAADALADDKAASGEAA